MHCEYHGGAGEKGADDLVHGDGGHDISWSIHGEWREGEEWSGDMQKKKKKKKRKR